jgi:hypothetical protein
MDKDKAIITQVCAKIAADLTNKSTGVDERLGEFTVLFSSITEIIMEQIYGGETSQTQNNNIIQMAKDTFNTDEVIKPMTESSKSNWDVTVKGTQHGPLPDWLIKACKRDGVTTVYDNRDGLAVNPKRPSFKAVDAEKAYWPPRGR